MLRDNWDKKICDEYRPQGCHGCPLKLHRIGEDACRAAYHWSAEKMEWVKDEPEVLRNLSRH